MLRTVCSLGFVAVVGLALSADQAHGWGAARTSSTGAYRSPYGSGYSHSSSGAVSGPYGSASHTGYTGYNSSSGFYHTGSTTVSTPYGGAGASYSGGAAYHGSSATYGGTGGAYHYTSGGTVNSGVYVNPYYR
jgi:hypothetical protein